MSEARVNNLSNESNTGGPTITGITTFSGTNYFVPPVGDTAQRPDNPEKGALRFNTDSKHLEYFKGDTIGWVEIEASNHEMDGGARGLWYGGYNPTSGTPTNINTIEYSTISTLGNSQEFGDLMDTGYAIAGACDGTRMIFGGGIKGPYNYQNHIQYVTISSKGNATDSGFNMTNSGGIIGLNNKIRTIFAGNSPYTNTIEHVTIQSLGAPVDYGDLHTAKSYMFTGASTTRGIIAGGIFCCPGISYNRIDYVTIMTTGDYVEFGDISTGDRYSGASGSNSTRMILAGGYGPGYTDTIEYLTIATLGNTIDFGDLVVPHSTTGGMASKTRFLIAGGYAHPSPYTNSIEYIQIMTTGNAKDFGDLYGSGVDTGLWRLGNEGSGGSTNHGGL